MFTITDLEPAEARRYAHLSFPANRWLLGELRSDVVVAGATLLGQPIGLALAQQGLSGTARSAVVHSVFVETAQRRIGVAAALMAFTERRLRLRGCERIFGTYLRDSPGADAIEALLQKCGWAPSQPRRLICQGDAERLGEMPWIGRTGLPHGCTVIPWIETSARARTGVALRGGVTGWRPQAANPFLDAPVEPSLSLALQAGGEVVGWVIWNQTGPSTVCCARLFVREDLREAGGGLALLSLSLQRMRAEGKWRHVVIDVEADGSRLAGFLQRRVARYLTSIRESRGSEKLLAPAGLNGLASADGLPPEDRQRPAPGRSLASSGLVNRITLLQERVALTRGEPAHSREKSAQVWRYNPADQPIGPLGLLIFQPTPFCNINCRYCYLPDRTSTETMDIETVVATIARVTEADMFSKEVLIAWHAGEPLVLPMEFYVEAVYRIRQAVPASTRIQHIIQTNGTLLNEKWCAMLKSLDIFVGLSLDGPAFIHDAARVTRSGKGTFEQVAAALRLLQQAGIWHGVLCVLSSLSLQHPDELFDFFRASRVRSLGFLPEEIAGVHADSTLTRNHAAQYRKFITRFYDLCQLHKAEAPSVREFLFYESLILEANSAVSRMPSVVTPFRILNVNSKGAFATFSPELLGMKDAAGERYALGNVHRDSLRGALETDRFRKMNAELRRGIEMCHATCDYFTVCGGGEPVSKVSVNGTLASTETTDCILRVQQLADSVLPKLEQRYGVKSRDEAVPDAAQR